MSKKTDTKKTENAVPDWSSFMMPENKVLSGNDLEVGGEITVQFGEVKQVTIGGDNPVIGIVADITTEEDHSSIWLFGQFGGQNGWFSLLHQVKGVVADINGKTFTFSKPESDKNPQGYAFRWELGDA